jgi:hypothetical protein
LKRCAAADIVTLMATALTKDELIGLLQNEVRILLHLMTKVDASQLDYRPSEKQRSTLELLRYLTIMGPELTAMIQAGGFDPARWQAAVEKSNALDYDQVKAAIEAQPQQYAQLLGAYSEEELQGDIEMFGQKNSRGFNLAFLVLGGCAAYRTQLFLYLKACGHDELSTYNLWGGADAPAAASA